MGLKPIWVTEKVHQRVKLAAAVEGESIKDFAERELCEAVQRYNLPTLSQDSVKHDDAEAQPCPAR